MKTQSDVIGKQCIKCKEYFFPAWQYFELIEDSYLRNVCKKCFSNSNRKLNKIDQAKVYVGFYINLPSRQIIKPNTIESLAIYSPFRKGEMEKYLKLHNRLFDTNWNSDDVIEFREQYKLHLWRYFNYKLCPKCNLWLPTYVGADDPEVVFNVLTDLRCKPDRINFKKAYNWSGSFPICNSCVGSQD